MCVYGSVINFTASYDVRDISNRSCLSKKIGFVSAAEHLMISSDHTLEYPVVKILFRLVSALQERNVNKTRSYSPFEAENSTNRRQNNVLKELFSDGLE